MVETPKRVLNKIQREDLDALAVKTVLRLEDYGYVAYLVGGCVRDLLLGFHPKDFDLVTDASPSQIKRVFRNSRIIGRRFRLAHVFYGKDILEVSTFRAPPPKADELDEGMIHDDNVYGTPEDDAFRRDFTINALFYDVSHDKIIDYCGGLSDLRRGVVRSIGDPNLRFREDPVRMIRALKFVGRLGFKLHRQVHEAMIEQRRQFELASPARNMEELMKILASGSAARITHLLSRYRFLKYFLPGAHHEVPKQSDAFFWKMLRALDEADQGRRKVDNSILLGSLLLPLGDPDGGLVLGTKDEDGYDIAHWAYDEIKSSPILKNCARATVDRLCRVLTLVKRLSLLKRSNRFKPASLIGRPYFVDALALFKIACTALGEGQDLVEEWNELALERGIDLELYLEGETGDNPLEVPAFGGPRPRRRRRRSRDRDRDRDEGDRDLDRPPRFGGGRESGNFRR